MAMNSRRGFNSTFYSFRKWLYKPKRDDPSLLAKFFYADEDLISIATELDSFDGRKQPQRCVLLVQHLRQCQDTVLDIINKISDQLIPHRRAPRDFRVKFPDDVLQESLSGQLWFGAECLAAGSNILHREAESASMRSLARAVCKHLDILRALLKDQALRDSTATTDELCDALAVFDRLFAEFELSYVGAMVQIKTMKDYDAIQALIVLYSESVEWCLKKHLLTQDMIDDYEPSIMFTIPRQAIVCGLIVYPDGPLNPSKKPEDWPEMLRPFHSLLARIKELLVSLSPDDLWTLERALCTENPPDCDLDDLPMIPSDATTSSNQGSLTPPATVFMPVVRIDRSSVDSDETLANSHVDSVVGISKMDSEGTFASKYVDNSVGTSRVNSDASLGTGSAEYVIGTSTMTVQGEDGEILTFEVPLLDPKCLLDEGDESLSDRVDEQDGSSQGDALQDKEESRRSEEGAAQERSEEGAAQERCENCGSCEGCIESCVKNERNCSTGTSTSKTLPEECIPTCNIPVETRRSDSLEGHTTRDEKPPVFLTPQSEEENSDMFHTPPQDHGSTSGIGEADLTGVRPSTSASQKVPRQQRSQDDSGCSSDVGSPEPRGSPGPAPCEHLHVAAFTQTDVSCVDTPAQVAARVEDHQDIESFARTYAEQIVQQALETVTKGDIGESSGEASGPNALSGSPNLLTNAADSSDSTAQWSDVSASASASSSASGGRSSSPGAETRVTRRRKRQRDVSRQQVAAASSSSSSSGSEEEGRESGDDVFVQELRQEFQSMRQALAGAAGGSGAASERIFSRSTSVPEAPGAPGASAFDPEPSPSQRRASFYVRSVSLEAPPLSDSSVSTPPAEVEGAVRAAEIFQRQTLRSRFKTASDLIHRLFVCIAGVADQLQTNSAADMRHILQQVLEIRKSPFDEEALSAGELAFSDASSRTVSPMPAALADTRAHADTRSETASVWSGGGEGPDVSHPLPTAPAAQEDLDNGLGGATAAPTLDMPPSIEAPPWLPDDITGVCMSCGDKFSFMRRRHHCRNCGKIFCQRCSSNMAPLPHYSISDPVRVCNRCFVCDVTPFQTQD